jgi:hypothetical protein
MTSENDKGMIIKGVGGVNLYKIPAEDARYQLS